MLKLRCETLIGYESRKCTQGEVIGALQSNININFSPQPAAPILKLSSAWQLAGLVHENGQLLTTQSVRYHTVCPVP
jgi:hypothetical protein